MRHLLDIAFTGLESVFLHPLRSAVSFSALVVMLLPYLVGLGLAEGLRAEAILATQFGADLYLTRLHAPSRARPGTPAGTARW